MIFKNANDAYEHYYNHIMKFGYEINDTMEIVNIGFLLSNPMDNHINNLERKWNIKYAELEWEWYLSGNPNATEISKHAKIWLNNMDENNCVNSNYGYQWMRNNQIEYVVNELKRDNTSRRAVISLYDGKEHNLYTKDTPCTLAITFSIRKELLNMSIMMRSNDLVFGFCNDQYCFSKLQQLIADKLELQIGTYFHFTNNLHIYKRHWKLNK